MRVILVSLRNSKYKFFIGKCGIEPKVHSPKMSILNKVLGFVLQNKLVVTLSVLLFAFFISTISLAVQKNNARANLRYCQHEYQQCTANCFSSKETTTTTTPTPPLPPVEAYRLPSYVFPITYDLALRPDIEEEIFNGTNRININITQATNKILMHSHRLNISSIVVENSDGNVIPNDFKLLEEEERLEITLTSTPSTGNYDVTINFVGNLTGIVGLYKSKYYNGTHDRAIATSKFEPTYARQAFPCFDEPAMKAKFKISLEIPSDEMYHALSNMPENRTDTNENGTRTVHFDESVRMSSYLACFIVSDFEFKNDTVQEGLEMRVFATPAQVNKTLYALNTGVNITRFYIDYFAVDYPLPKLDMVAIPDFVSGAMEHWGLVTFRETALLYEEGISSTANKQRVAGVIAHELAHMWFGNLVTMAWWDELWLNEGFASYIEYKGCNSAEPTWGMLDQFLIEDLHSVLTLDATLASHPIVQKVETPDQITEVFDTITYNKGASVIRMMEDFVEPDKFQKSVTNYLNKHAYGNAVTDDLLTEIENLGLDDIKHIMGTWTKQKGFPVVNVTKVTETEYHLTQNRFFSNPDNANEADSVSEYNYRWHIPITYQTDKNSNSTLEWFKNEDTELKITLDFAPKWIKFNKDQVGYYRVNYEPDMWTTLINLLKDETETLSIANRGHLINDAFSLAEATILPYETALNLTSYLTKETQYVPWSVASTNLLNLKNRLSGETAEKFKKFARNLANATYTTVSWDVGGDHLQNHLRTTVLNFACSVGLPECLEKAGAEFDSWLASGVPPQPDLRNIIYYYGMSAVGDAEKWEKMWAIYKNEMDASEKTKLVYGLSAIKDHGKLAKFVQLAWETDNVRDQDYFTCIQNIAANPIGESIVWEYVRENWLNLVERFSLNDRYLGRMIPSICGRFSTTTRLEEVNAFFAKHEDAGAGQAAREQTKQDIANRIKWLENNQQKVANWLNANVE